MLTWNVLHDIAKCSSAFEEKDIQWSLRGSNPRIEIAHGRKANLVMHLYGFHQYYHSCINLPVWNVLHDIAKRSSAFEEKNNQWSMRGSNPRIEIAHGRKANLVMHLYCFHQY